MQTIAEKRLDKLMALLCGHQSPAVRFFGIMAACMKREVTTACNTMETNGVILRVSPDFMEEHTDIELCFVLIHEAFHKVARHPVRLRDCAVQNRELTHVAADYAVNLALELDTGIPYPMVKGGLLNREYIDSDSKALNVEAIIKLLLSDPPQGGTGECDASDDASDEQDDDGSADSDDSDTESDSGDSADDSSDDSGPDSGGDDDDSEPDTDDSEPACVTGDLLPAPDDYDENENQREVAQAAIVAQGAGDLPAYLKEVIKGTLVDAKRDWMSELKTRFAAAIDKSDYSLRVPSQRYAAFGCITPKLRAPAMNKIAIIRDTSWSISHDQLELASQQIKTIVDEWNPMETLIIDHTSEITQVERLCVGMEPKNIDAVGRGGTTFQPVLDMLEKEGVDVALWITDCQPCDRAKEPIFPVIFLAVDPSNRYWFDSAVGFGEYIDLL